MLNIELCKHIRDLLISVMSSDARLARINKHLSIIHHTVRNNKLLNGLTIACRHNGKTRDLAYFHIDNDTVIYERRRITKGIEHGYFGYDAKEVRKKLQFLYSILQHNILLDKEKKEIQKRLLNTSTVSCTNNTKAIYTTSMFEN